MKYWTISINGVEKGHVKANAQGTAAREGIAQYTGYGRTVASYQPKSKRTYSCLDTRGHEVCTVTVKLPRNQKELAAESVNHLLRDLKSTYKD